MSLRSHTDATDTDLVLRRCHDPELIELILGDDYYDTPVCCFPKSLLRTAARELLAQSHDVQFVTVELRGELAGFAFAHRLGPAIWRKFVCAHLMHHPFAIAWLVLRLRVLSLLIRRFGQQRGTVLVGDTGDEMKVRRLGLTSTGQPFHWSPLRPDVGQLDLYYIRGPYRGLGPGITTSPVRFGRIWARGRQPYRSARRCHKLRVGPSIPKSRLGRFPHN